MQTIPAEIAGMQAANDWHGAIAARMKSIGGRTWLVAAVIGILVSSLLVY